MVYSRNEVVKEMETGLHLGREKKEGRLVESTCMLDTVAHWDGFK